MAGFPSFCLVSVLFCPILSTYSTHMDVIYSIIGIAKSRNLIRSGYILLLYRGDKRRDFRHSKSLLTIGNAVKARKGQRSYTRLSDGVSLTGQKVIHRDEVAEHEPEHHVLDVEADQRLEERQGHDAQLEEKQP